MWVNHLWTPTPGVQITERSINDIIQRNYANGPPMRLPHPLVVAVTEDGESIMNHKGAMRLVSPCEYTHAALKACYRDVAANKGDQIVRQWKHAFQSAQFVFVKLEEAMLSMYAFQLREDALAESTQVAWTAIQRVQMVIREKHVMEARGGKVTAARLAAAFSKGVRLASTSEPMSPAFVDAALTIEARVLCSEAARSAVNFLEDTYGIAGPFNSVYKLQAVVNRCKTTTAIEWTMSSLVDSLRMGFLEVGDFSVAKLNKEHCDMCLLKQGFHSHFLVRFLDCNQVDADAKAKARTVLATHASVRKMLTGYPDQPPPEISWQAAEKPSTIKFIELVEAGSRRCLMLGGGPETPKRLQREAAVITVSQQSRVAKSELNMTGRIQLFEEGSCYCCRISSCTAATQPALRILALQRRVHGRASCSATATMGPCGRACGITRASMM